MENITTVKPNPIYYNSNLTFTHLLQILNHSFNSWLPKAVVRKTLNIPSCCCFLANIHFTEILFWTITQLSCSIQISSSLIKCWFVSQVWFVGPLKTGIRLEDLMVIFLLLLLTSATSNTKLIFNPTNGIINQLHHHPHPHPLTHQPNCDHHNSVSESTAQLCSLYIESTATHLLSSLMIMRLIQDMVSRRY